VEEFSDPLFWVKKGKKEGRKAGRAAKKGLDSPLQWKN